MRLLGFEGRLGSLGSLLGGAVSDRTRHSFLNPTTRVILAGVLILLGIVSSASALVFVDYWAEITVYSSGEETCFHVTRYSFYSYDLDLGWVHTGEIIHRSPFG